MSKLFSIMVVLVLLLAASLACSMPLTPVATLTATSTPLSTITPVINPTSTVPLVTVTTQPVPVATNTSQPPTQTVQVIPTNSANGIPCNLAGFEGDITYADDTVVPAGTSFVKKWQLRNAGSCTWTSGYKLIFISGDAMSVSGTTQLTNGTIPPGNSVEAAVNLTAPADAGTYQGNFRLQSSDGSVFGIGDSGVGILFVRIIVEQAQSNNGPIVKQVTPNITKPKIPNIIKPSIPTLSRNLKLTNPYMTGADVTKLQQKLLARGYSVVGNADGIFGKNTDKGVRQFQADQGLIVDGIVGQKTWAALWS
jgi:hypothetical protein